MAVALMQIVIAELRQRFIEVKEDFLADIKDYSANVNNNIINFNEIGALPDVLIDSAVYPIASVARNDNGIPVSLHKLDTKNTPVTDDELFALAYDKKSSVMADHLTALALARVKLGLWSLAPSANATATPVLKTTGANYLNRKRLTLEDMANYKDAIDTLQHPLENRKLVMSSHHVNDLLLVDQAFRDRYYNTESGKLIGQINGFKIYENINTPTYNNTTFAKNAYGAAPSGTDTPASVYFNTLNAMRAMGDVKVYYRDASMDPENRQSVFGARTRYIVSPVTAGGIGAIISDINS